MATDVRRAVAARDAAFARVRRVTAGLVAAGVGLTAVFSSLAASSTHHPAAARRPPARTVRRAAHAAPVRAPAPPLVGNGAATPTPPPPAPAQAQAQAPLPSTAAPTVVSGGS